MIKLTRLQLTALGEVMREGHAVLLEQVQSVRLNTGETLSGGGNLVVATVFHDDQRDGEFQIKYLLGSGLTHGKALQLT